MLPLMTLDSWEPRFVVEHYNTEALAYAIQLWRLCASREFGELDGFGVSQILRKPDMFLARYPNRRWQDQRWEELREPLAVPQLAAAIAEWLRKGAQFPRQPNFDGSEAAGFSIGWDYFGYEDGSPFSRGALMVRPRWFEIHK